MILDIKWDSNVFTACRTYDSAIIGHYVFRIIRGIHYIKLNFD